VETPLQYGQATQRFGLPPASAKKHRPDRPKADHVLTFKLHHPMGAHQKSGAAGWSCHKKSLISRKNFMISGY
jgi:hypothetical protein